ICCQGFQPVACKTGARRYSGASTNAMDERYEPAKIEPKWQQEWERSNLYVTRQDPDRPKFYVLELFPYPSGDGLSVGHLHNYVPCDVIGRYKRMAGYNVLHAMGWDAFGLPAE